MFQALSENLQSTFKNLRGYGKLSESNISEALRSVRLALLEADVDFEVTKTLIETVKEKSLGEKVIKSIKPGQQIVKIFNDELINLLGGSTSKLNLDPPSYFLLVGLNGAGKTTTSAKLALHLKKEGRRPVIVACDLYRLAAVEQLVTLGKQIDIPVYQPKERDKDLVKVANLALEWAKDQDATTIIFDTAGRQELNKDLILELKSLRDFLNPKETLLVADSATGQQAVSVAKTFDSEIGLSGIILSKFDGDTRGGAALSMNYVTKQPIKFVGNGEKVSDFEIFHPDRMAGRILGMGDIVGLVEKAVDFNDEKEAVDLMKRMKSSSFNFNDFLLQLKMMQKIGGIQGIIGMLPGIGNKINSSDINDDKIKHTEAIVLSMTPKERNHPEIIKASRRKRIAMGSGMSITKVNSLLKQFGQMRKMMRNKGKMMQMVKELTGSKGGNFKL